MAKDKDRETKTAPPRESDSARFNRFLTQTGLNASTPGSAAARRRSAGGSKTRGRK